MALIHGNYFTTRTFPKYLFYVIHQNTKLIYFILFMSLNIESTVFMKCNCYAT